MFGCGAAVKGLRPLRGGKPPLTAAPHPKLCIQALKAAVCFL